jgi:hypothetical protein
VLAAVVAWALFVPAADWLAHHDIGHATGSGLETARNNARGNLLALTAGMAAFGALVFTARSFTLQRRALELSQRTFEENARLTEQGQVTDRYTKAIEQLGSGNRDVRIGGIYALERIARDSGQDHPTVMEVLAMFVCEHSRLDDIPDEDGSVALRAVEADIQAAFTVLGRRNPAHDKSQISLPLTNLKSATLTAARLARANLSYTALVVARLPRADLNRADLNNANLAGANLTDANLSGANLTDANLSGTHLTRANLSGAHLNRANLTRTNLTGADLAGADLTGVVWPSFPAPAGWRLSDGRLVRRDA